MKFIKTSKLFSVSEEFPLLPLREIVLFPQSLIPVFVTYNAGIRAIDEAMQRDKRMFAACIKDVQTGETYRVGSIVRIVQQMRLPDGTYRVVLQGEYRGNVRSLQPLKNTMVAKITPIPVEIENEAHPEIKALIRAVQMSFLTYTEFSKKINTETIATIEKAESPERLVNLICNVITLKIEKKIEMLGMTSVKERLSAMLEILEQENEIFGIQKNISGKVKSRMEKSQREYILHEQLKEIHKELGKDVGEDEFTDLEKSITAKYPPAEIVSKAQKELARLRKLQAMSPEAGVLRGYLEWIADLPWSNYSEDSEDLNRAEAILNEDHFNMKKAKERILEFIAVRQLTNRINRSAHTRTVETVAVSLNNGMSNTVELLKTNGMQIPSVAIPDAAGTEQEMCNSIKGPILCFVGPPGIGKTSLGKSVARALGRRFVRISLGGVRDEAEIRGHRKTYVSALPGKIIQSMRKAGAMNPVFLLDEIDKLSSDFRGDPASALLEVLDPEQNFAFSDHYMEVPYDLSKVLFITTANSLHTIPIPLLDRMEIIEIPGYGENEKLAIAKQFLLPKELKENGLDCAQITFTDDAVKAVIQHWTMESGVRGLERELARCIRRIAREAVEEQYGNSGEKPIESFIKTVDVGDLDKLLGRHKYKNDVVFKEARTGVAYGLAWTETGGTMLPVETISFEGNGELIMTGNLGDVMKESARIALSYLRSVKDRYNFLVKDVGKIDFHVHVPEGAIPKDGPSAGITLASSLLSTLCRIPPKPGIAMTGELTLTGRVLPIGGLKEKILAAIRNGMEKVLLPLDNREEWEELDAEIKASIAVDFMENAADAFTLLFDEGILRKDEPKKAGKRKG
ncbi:MAG: endopeptidase La [Treponema sp.]|jgi:ATP-dependent Lon protease|nr:endopeptidase La [Treponema sp.]